MKWKVLAALIVTASTQPALANIDIQFDFTYDTNGFFAANPSAVTALNAAASVFETRFTDSLSAITSSGPNDFSTSFFNPADPSGADITLSGQSIGTDIIRVYAGGANLSSGTLGIGGPGGYGCSGTFTFCSASTLNRGQGTADFGPWGGSISFDDASTNWNFSVANGPSSSQYDFYSVAVHELAHLLGYGSADSYYALVSGGNFTGTNAEALYGGPVPLYTADGGAHWASGVTSTINGVGSQEAEMTPTIANGQRKYFTDLDFAAMKDIGWQVSAVPEADTWAMMLAGLGLIGAVIRRHHAR